MILYKYVILLIIHKKYNKYYITQCNLELYRKDLLSRSLKSTLFLSKQIAFCLIFNQIQTNEFWLRGQTAEQ